jgi:hypothetical protein
MEAKKRDGLSGETIQNANRNYRYKKKETQRRTATKSLGISGAKAVRVFLRRDWA